MSDTAYLNALTEHIVEVWLKDKNPLCPICGTDVGVKSGYQGKRFHLVESKFLNGTMTESQRVACEGCSKKMGVINVP